MADISLPASAASLQAQLDDALAVRAVMLELGAQTIWMADAAGKPVSLSGALSRHFGDSLLGWEERIHPADLEPGRRAWAEAVARGHAYDVQLRVQVSDGTYRWMRARARPARDPQGQVLAWHGVLIDVEDQLAAYRILRETEERYRLAARASGDAIWDWDLQSDRIQWSEGLTEMFGYPPEAMDSGMDWWLAHIHPGDRARIEASVRHSIRHGTERWSGEYRFLRADGSYADVLDRGHLLCAPDGTPLRMVGAMHDLSERKQREEQVRWLACHDTLTGLPNRRRFLEELEASLPSSGHEATMFAVLLVDLDEFKRINDTLGHPAGDALLVAVAGRLRGAVGPKGVVARLGGDEFAVILRSASSSADVTQRIEALLSTLRAPFEHDGRPLECGASIGASLYPLHGRNSDELMKHADIALYAAKDNGRDCYSLFQASMRAGLQLRASMISLAREALDRGRIEPFYQPKVAIATGEITGFEALLRWRNVRGEVQAPALISAAFEQVDLANAISDHMLVRVIGDMRAWLDAGLRVGRVALNASAAEFRRDGFAERLLGRLRHYRVPAELIEIEITESVFLGQGATGVAQALRTLSRAGVRIALDDFGTGYASLSHLKRYPVEVIKIDKSFVRDIDSDADDAAIVRALIMLGRNLGIEVVAEGVETRAQLAFLESEGCAHAQGYLFGRALPSADVPALIRGWSVQEPAIRAA